MTLQQALFDAQPSRPADPGQPAPWLVDRLIRAGHLTETGLTRRARPRPCPRCHTWTVAGLDADLLAFETHCDTTPLTALGEVVVLATGRRTLELVHTRGRFELEQRWSDHIQHRPAGGRPGLGRYDVLPTHACGAPVPHQWTTASAFAQPTNQTPAQAAGQPPF